MLADQPDGLISIGAHRENLFSFFPSQSKLSLLPSLFFSHRGLKVWKPHLLRLVCCDARGSRLFSEAVAAAFCMMLSMQCSTWLTTVCCICIPCRPARTLARTDPAMHLMQSANMLPSVWRKKQKRKQCVSLMQPMFPRKASQGNSYKLVRGEQTEMHIVQAPSNTGRTHKCTNQMPHYSKLEELSMFSWLQFSFKLGKPLKNDEAKMVYPARLVIGSVLVKKLPPTFQP